MRLELEFVYLAVILDAFSRRVIGWALEPMLEAALTPRALGMALAARRPSPGGAHHSDRGVQYASRDYTQRLRDHGIQISMSRPGNPWDHAARESFIKTLKYEECYRVEYRWPRPALQSAHFWKRSTTKNACIRRSVACRPQSSSGGCSFKTTRRRCAASFLMSFLRHREIYPFDEDAILQDRALPHRTDEFPAGYSLAGCTPAVPASTSPVDSYLAGQRLRCTIKSQRTAGSVLTVCLSPGDHRKGLARFSLPVKEIGSALNRPSNKTLISIMI